MNDPDPSHPASTRINGNAVAAHSDSQNGNEVPSQESNWLQRLTQSLVAKFPNTSLRTQMEGALAEDGGDDAFSAEEKAMLRNILSLREMRVDDVMIPRADIDAVEHDISLGTLLAVYEDVGHSRLPVYRETLDDPVGMVHIKDVLGLMTQESGIDRADDVREGPSALDSMEGAKDESEDALDRENVAAKPAASNHIRSLGNVDLDRPLKDLGLVRDVLFVPPSMPAVDLMASMRAARTQMALVIDEYGGTDGLVSLEDVVETVVGDIEDEHDDESDIFIAEAAPNLFIADAKADLDDVVKTIGVTLPLDDEALEDVDSLGGFIFTLIGRIPVRGELISVSEGLEFEIMEADRRRIRRVKIRIKPTKKQIKRAVPLSRSPSDEHQADDAPTAPTGASDEGQSVPGRNKQDG